MANSTMCRVCESTETLFNIFAEDDRKILDKMRFLLNHPIEPNDLLPQWICTECFAKLNNAYNFKKQYEITNQKYIKAASSISQVDRNEYSDKIIENSDMVVKEEFDIDQNENACGSKSFKADNVYVSEIVVKEELNSSYSDGETGGEEDEVIRDEDAPASTASVAEMSEEVDDHEDDNDTPQIGSTQGDGSIMDSECNTIEKGESSKRQEASGSTANNTSIPQTLRKNDESQIFLCQMSDTQFEIHNHQTESIGAHPHQTKELEAARENPEVHNEQFFNLSYSEHNASSPTNNIYNSQWFKTFTLKTFLKEHLTHRTPDPFKCPKCEKHFSTRKELGQHYQCHSDLDAFKCFECGKIFKHRSSLVEHELSHRKPDLFKCPKCGKHFSTRKDLRLHKEFHSDPDAFKCSICGKIYKTRKNLMEHELLHQNPDLFKCQKCNKSISTRFSLKLHIQKCGKPIIPRQKLQCDPDFYKCKECGKRCSNSRSLKLHERIHSYKFVCLKCGRRFNYKYYLTEHELSYTNPDLFKCKMCGKQFATRKFLGEHEKYHRTACSQILISS